MELTGEQINEFLSKAILESQLGEAVKKAIERNLEDLQKRWDNPFDAVVKSHINQILDKEIMVNFRPALEKRIKESVAQNLTDELIENIFKAGLEKLRRV